MQPQNTEFNPQLSAPEVPATPATGERVPVLPTASPEAAGLERGADRQELAAEASAAVADAVPAAGPAVATPAAPTTDDTTTSSSSPLVANDDDVIEKEWVDKAKDIILKTRDNPHDRSAKVNELQRDYLKKRYGKVLGASE